MKVARLRKAYVVVTALGVADPGFRVRRSLRRRPGNSLPGMWIR